MSLANRQAAYLKKTELPSISYKWMNWALPLLLTCAVLFFAEDYVSNPDTLPVTKIRIHSNLNNVDEELLHAAINSVVDGGYFTVDVEQVREVIEILPWVYEASVRRVWPDTLSISIVEQKPIAVSKQSGLINAKGNVFKPSNKILTKSLPVFDGDVSLYKLMLSKYYEMNALLNKSKLNITYLSINARRAVELKLNNGLKIVLGRGDTISRLKRFISVYKETLVKHVAAIDAVDLRYTNGMAISWKNNLKNTKEHLGDMKHV